MRSITGSLDQLQPLVEVSIGSPDELFRRETCIALIDTGATRTCVTHRLIGELGLKQRAKLLVSSATEPPARKPAYGYSLGLFCAGAGGERTLYVIPHEFVAPPFVNVLLGMDVLSRGRLTFEYGSFRFDFDF